MPLKMPGSHALAPPFPLPFLTSPPLPLVLYAFVHYFLFVSPPSFPLAYLFVSLKHFITVQVKPGVSEGKAA